MRRSLRDLCCSATSQPVSFSANGSSLLPSHTCKHVLPGNGPVQRLKLRLNNPRPQIFLIVLRDSPVRRAISRIGIFLRNAQSRITLKSPMSITPKPPGKFR